jgi:hypothetical protein
VLGVLGMLGERVKRKQTGRGQAVVALARSAALSYAFVAPVAPSNGVALTSVAAPRADEEEVDGRRHRCSLSFGTAAAAAAVVAWRPAALSLKLHGWIWRETTKQLSTCRASTSYCWQKAVTLKSDAFMFMMVSARRGFLKCGNGASEPVREGALSQGCEPRSDGKEPRSGFFSSESVSQTNECSHEEKGVIVVHVRRK